MTYSHLKLQFDRSVPIRIVLLRTLDGVGARFRSRGSTGYVGKPDVKTKSVPLRLCSRMSSFIEYTVVGDETAMSCRVADG